MIEAPRSLTEIRFSPALNLARLGAWGTKSGLAVLDQAVFSGTSLVLNVLLARWLEPEAYGAFAVAFSLFLFISGFHNALVLEPMSVLGPAKYPDRAVGYFLSQLRVHWRLMGLLAGLPTVAGGALFWFRPSDSLWQAILGSGLALALILLLWVTRRFFYVLHRPSGALLGSGLYVFLFLGGLVAIHQASYLSPLTTFLAMGLASLGAAALSVWLAGAMRISGTEPPSPGFNQVLAENWHYGRWMVAAALLYSASVQVQTFITAGFIGLEAAGVLRAVQIPMLAMTQTITAIATLGLPTLSYEFGQRSLSALRRKGMLITGALTAMAAAYTAVLWAMAGPVERLLYGGKFAAYAWLIPTLSLVGVFTALGTGYSLVLRAVQKPEHYLIAGCVTAPVGVVSAVALTWQWGVAGAAASMVLTYVAAAGTAFYLYRAWFPRETSPMKRVIRHRQEQNLRYRGLPVHAPPGVHEEAFVALSKYLSPGQSVIELGAGSGAFAKRLLDAGLTVHAVDFDPTGWALKSIPLLQQDLNAPTWNLPSARYDAAVAVEVLEHIENPSSFLQNVGRLLKSGGIFFLTTPNVVSVESRRRMLLRGELAFFGKQVLFDGGHLTILPYWLLEDVFAKENYRVVERVFVGKQALVFRAGRAWWKCAVVPLVDFLLLVVGIYIPSEAAFCTNVAYIAAPEEESKK